MPIFESLGQLGTGELSLQVASEWIQNGGLDQAYTVCAEFQDSPRVGLVQICADLDRAAANRADV